MEQNRLNRIPAIATAGLLLGLALTCLAPDTAAAQPAAINPEQACRDDAFRLCNDYVPDIPQIVACLKRERQNLSPACAVVFAVPEPDPAPTPARKTPPKKKPQSAK